jgi:hypothetical protein
LLALCRHGDRASRAALRAHAVDHGTVRMLIIENMMAVFNRPPPLPT